MTKYKQNLLQQPWLSKHIYRGAYVVVYHVIIVSIGHGLLKKFWHMVIGCGLRAAGSTYIVLFFSKDWHGSNYGETMFAR